MSLFQFFIPEILIGSTLIFIVLIDLFLKKERSLLKTITLFVGTLSALGLVLIFDKETAFFRSYFLVLSILSVITSLFSREISSKSRTEFYIFVLSAVLGFMFIATASNLIILFVAIQLSVTASFFLIGYNKRLLVSAEASIKFLVPAVVSLALFVVSCGLLYSWTNSFEIEVISKFLSENPAPYTLTLISFFLFFVSLCFFMGIFPFSFWIPDALQGAPLPSAFIVCAGLPVAGIAIGIRFFQSIFHELLPFNAELLMGQASLASNTIALIAGVSMGFGALLSVLQTDARRLFGYLIVFQMGFLCMGFLVLDRVGVAGILYILLVDLFSLVGIFSVLSFFLDTKGTCSLRNLKGQMQAALPESLFLLIFLACFIGLPPFPGFLGRFALVGAVVQETWHILALVSILSTVAVILAFARLAYSLNGSVSGKSEGGLPSYRYFLGSLLLPVSILMIFADRVISLIQHAFFS